ncbi:hypothetical protein GBAR_LOCUS9602 [Geodia barretti]|uniref:Uncharacterized protein n=1 Tax=Geodia barretti TaxID=519541 RepID=A0AA35RSH3_GEOBA|nr:hypothetical protein GBAR_LOCUS9602 [Geodia barretti]
MVVASSSAHDDRVTGDIKAVPPRHVHLNNRSFRQTTNPVTATSFSSTHFSTEKKNRNGR